MPYYAQRSGKTWQLIHREGKVKPRNVPKDSPEAKRLGFRPEMTTEEARIRAASLRAEAGLAREARRSQRAAELEKRDSLLRSAYLTDDDAAEFMATLGRDYKIKPAHWSTMQKIIVTVELHPSDWFPRKQKLYEQFRKLRCSYNYAKKLLRYLNLWGGFLCRKQNRAWDRVPGMDGAWRNRLEAGRRGFGKKSLPLSYEALKRRRGELEPANYGWLLATVAFGLRPEEADQLQTQNARWYFAEEDGHEVLWMFQKKLYDRGVPEPDCWKGIPVKELPQREALPYIRKGLIKRPIGQGGAFMRETFGPGYSRYAGRNNFAAWLEERGYDLECRRAWMGHLSVKTTEAYERKRRERKALIRGPRRRTG